MEQYIPKSAVVAEIKNLIERAEAERVLHPKTILAAKNYLLIEDYKKLLSFIDSLEVKEVDLDYIKDELDEVVKIHKPNGDFGWGTLYNVATHFFELGLMTKNWVKERMEECPYRQVGCTMYEGRVLECKGACSWVVDHLRLKELKAQKGEKV